VFFVSIKVRVTVCVSVCVRVCVCVCVFCFPVSEMLCKDCLNPVYDTSTNSVTEHYPIIVISMFMNK
jgi:hypothetical protein